MAHKTKLSAASVNSLKQPGRYYDSNSTGLHLYIRKSGSKSWVQRVTLNGKIVDIGLGNSAKVKLIDARVKSLENLKLISEGIDPRKFKSEHVIIPNFRQMSDELLIKKKAELRSTKHFKQWGTTLNTYVLPTLGNHPVDEISVDDVLNVINKIWITKNVTARRVLGRIASILDYATTKGFRSGSNPAVWKGSLENLLPKLSKVQKSTPMPSLPRSEIPRWWNELQQRDGTGAKALMLLTMFAARSGEIRGMRHSELEYFSDKEADEKGYKGVWTIPRSRMKSNVEHSNPIIQPVFDLLKQLPRHGDLVFPSQKGGMLSDMTLSAIMKRMHANDGIGFIDSISKRPAVPHGLRSTFRDWAADTGQRRDAAELQLAHRVGDSSERSYFRSQMLGPRTEILTDWNNFLDGCQSQSKKGPSRGVKLVH